MRLALVADWLPTYGGAEHVIAALHRMWPESPLFTTVYNKARLPALAKADVRPVGRLQWLYGVLGRHQWLLPLLPRAMEDIDLSGYDVVFSSSHAVGKGIVPPSGAVHVCYCHTPMRYAWEMEAEYLKDFRVQGWLKKKVKQQLKRLRRWDVSTARRADVFIANSTETQSRIARIYGRDSIVIPPPVDDRFFESVPGSPAKDGYYLALGRLVPYKKFDLLIQLANALNINLVIGGTGHEEARLRALAGPTVTFKGFVPDADLPRLYADAKAVLFPQVEDAGIVPLEAQASGTPVVAFGKGGVLDVVQHGVTGVLANAQTVESFSAAVLECEAKNWDRAAIRDSARKFSQAKFKERIETAVAGAVQMFGKR
ncbi:MAG TPA: glycosyltransferase [Candidatus Peribacteria bacterium]|nr:glycosyltransferase [Candidatus Peribacteria bacterium]